MCPIRAFPPVVGLAVALAVAAARPGAAQTTSPTSSDGLLVDAAWLKVHLHDPDLVLLHVGEESGYATAHIPGARFIELKDVSTPHDMSDGSLMLELPPAAVLRAHLESLGVSDDSRVVVYYGDDWVTPATRVLFTLDYLGLGGRSSLLNGGMRAWTAAGGEVTAAATPPRRGRLAARATLPRVVDAAYVHAIAAHPHVKLVDARAAVFYDGVEEASGRRGHIPGALSIPFSDVVDDALMVRPDALRERFRAAGIVPGDTVVAYCHIGQQATAVVFAARLLGYPAHLYDGSMQDWARHAVFPVETGAGRSGGHR